MGNEIPTVLKIPTLVFWVVERFKLSGDTSALEEHTASIFEVSQCIFVV
jgi:hypothetical protein